MSSYGAIIAKIEKGSLGEELGLAPGDIITHIDKKVLRDIIDYKLFSDESKLSLSVSRNGSSRIVEVRNFSHKPLGIYFQSSLFDGLKNCKNKCIFCFVDQLPKGLRKSLYLKDDDYRLSFLYGNFVTFNNLDWKDINRIIGCRLSPLYLSLHSTNLEVRSLLMKKSNPLIFDYFKAFSEAGISVHVQVVLCPGINDGLELERTLNDLYDNFKCVRSVGIVPVGLTRFREKLPPLKSFNSHELKSVIEQVGEWRLRHPSREGSKWVYLADEFYLGSGVPLPPMDDYDDFPQIENGIGLSRCFLETIKREMSQFDPAKIKGRFIIATSILAQDLLRNSLRRALERAPTRLEIVPITNHLFGPGVTVAGLVTGRDLLNQIRGKKADALLIPEVMLNEDDLSIDSIPLSQIEKELGTVVKVIPWDGSGLLGYLTKHSSR